MSLVELGFRAGLYDFRPKPTNRLRPFPFGKSGSGEFANCSLCGTEASISLSFSSGPVCSSFSAEARSFAGLVSTNKFAISLIFSSLTLALSSSPFLLLHLSFYLNFSGRSGRKRLLFPSVLLGYNGSPNTRFSRETPRLMS